MSQGPSLQLAVGATMLGTMQLQKPHTGEAKGR